MAGKGLARDSEVKGSVISWPQTLDTEFSYVGIQILMPRWDKCLNVNRGFVEVWCVPSAIHVMYHAHIEETVKFSASVCCNLIL